MLRLSTAAATASRLFLSVIAGFLLIAGSVWALVLGFSDLQFRSGGSADVERALKMAPWNAAYLAQWSLLTQDQREANRALEKAVAQDPYYSWAWIQLGLAAERDEKMNVAERDLLRAAAVDRGFQPRWALSNFFFRRANVERFWYWTKQALLVNEGDANPVFRLAWRMEPDAATILHLAVPDIQIARRELLTYLIQERPKGDLLPIILAVLPAAESADVPSLLFYADNLLNLGDVDQAIHIWNAMCDRKLLPFRPRFDNILINADFATIPSGKVFDWLLPTQDGVTSERETVSHRLRLQLSGGQPEHVRILSQRIPVQSGRDYEFRHHAAVEINSGVGGLRWRIFAGPQVVTESTDIAAGTLVFHSANNGLATIALEYDRPRGATALAGSMVIDQLSLRLVKAQSNR